MCFFVSILIIGMLTAVIGDVATHVNTFFLIFLKFFISAGCSSVARSV